MYDCITLARKMTNNIHVIIQPCLLESNEIQRRANRDIVC